MSDQCGYCTVRGDLKECESQPCTTHDSWYVKQLTDRVEKSEAKLKRIQQVAIHTDQGNCIIPSSLILGDDS